MTDVINCPNCGAPVDLTRAVCPFCDTPYPRPRKTAVAVAVPVEMDGEALEKIIKEISGGFMTPNEARQRLGMPRI